METNRLMARLSAAVLIATTISVACLRPTHAQTTPGVLASTGSAVAHNISQPSERVEMIVKSSRILTLEERIPKTIHPDITQPPKNHFLDPQKPPNPQTQNPSKKILTQNQQVQ